MILSFRKRRATPDEPVVQVRKVRKHDATFLLHLGNGRTLPFALTLIPTEFSVCCFRCYAILAAGQKVCNCGQEAPPGLEPFSLLSSPQELPTLARRWLEEPLGPLEALWADEFLSDLLAFIRVEFLLAEKAQWRYGPSGGLRELWRLKPVFRAIRRGGAALQKQMDAALSRSN